MQYNKIQPLWIGGWRRRARASFHPWSIRHCDSSAQRGGRPGQRECGDTGQRGFQNAESGCAGAESPPGGRECGRAGVRGYGVAANLAGRWRGSGSAGRRDREEGGLLDATPAITRRNAGEAVARGSGVPSTRGVRERGVTGLRGIGRAGERERYSAGERVLAERRARLGRGHGADLLWDRYWLGRGRCRARQTSACGQAGRPVGTSRPRRWAGGVAGRRAGGGEGAPSSAAQRGQAGGLRRACGSPFALAPAGRRGNGMTGQRGGRESVARDCGMSARGPWVESRDLSTGLRECGMAV